MKKKTITALFSLALFLKALMVSCDLSKPIYTITDIPPSEPISYPATDIQNAESCWLQTFYTNFGEWVGDHQCTALARLLTTAPGYGKDANGTFLGGYDYVKQQQSVGTPVPFLAEVKNNLKPCDNLILVGPKYDATGHTVVTFYVDLPNDAIYYLDQNYNNEPISPRKLSISENENTVYVISAECEKPINCQIGSLEGPIIAAPESSQPEIDYTLEAATLLPSITSLNGLIAFIRDANIWIYDLSTKNEKQLTTESDYSNLAISSDGTRIVFVKSFGNPLQYSVGVIEISTGIEKFIVESKRTPFTLLESYFIFSNPQWAKGNSEVWFNTSDGRVEGNDTWVYTFTDNLLIKGKYANQRNLRVSTDTSEYVYADFSNAPPVVGNGINLIENSNNKTEKVIVPLTSGLGINDMCWMGNNQKIAVSETLDSGESYIFTFDTNDLSERKILNITGDSISLGCSENSDILVYGYAGEIYLYDGKTRVNITDGIEPDIWLQTESKVDTNR